jgi:S1-C subfamily serine protease
MRKSFLLLSSLCVFTLHAQTSVTLDSFQNGSQYSVYDNDFIFIGEGLKFTIKSDKDKTVELFYLQDGKKIFIKNIEVKNSTITTFPEDNDVLKFDSEGEVTFVFEEHGKKIEEINIHFVSQDNYIVAQKNISITEKNPLQNATYAIDPSTIISNQRGEKEKLIYKKLLKSTVLIESDSGELGSGVIISKDGKILTNWHVTKNNPAINIAFKPSSIYATDPSKNTFYKAKIIKMDKQKDLAIIQIIDKQVIKDLTPIKFAKVKNLSVGDDIFTIGHPEGEPFTFDTGIISQIRGNYTWKTNEYHQANYIIQTKNSISSGNSGGPLVNDNLELVGLNTFSNTKGQNLNFAVSVDDIADFIANKKSSAIALNTDRTKMKYKVLEVKNGFDTNKTPIATYYMDSNNNGIVDLVAIDVGRKGVFNYYLFDSNEDGKFEKKAYDKDGDGIVERTLVQ